MIYEYGCECGHREERTEKIGPNKGMKKCPACGKKSLDRLISASIGFVRGEAKTIGQVMDRNAKKLGRYEKESLRKDYVLSGQEAKDKQRKQDREEINKVSKMSKEQQQRYIHDG
jgi:putative FmdB family regulatory protein